MTKSRNFGGGHSNFITYCLFVKLEQKIKGFLMLNYFPLKQILEIFEKNTNIDFFLIFLNGNEI